MILLFSDKLGIKKIWILSKYCNRTKSIEHLRSLFKEKIRLVVQFDYYYCNQNKIA